jgi:hypothetical protein
MSKNMDKYYVLQVVESSDKSKYWCVAKVLDRMTLPL